MGKDTQKIDAFLCFGNALLDVVLCEIFRKVSKMTSIKTEKMPEKCLFLPCFSEKNSSNKFFLIDNQTDIKKVKKKFEKVLPDKKKVVLLQSQNERNGAREKGRGFGKFFERME